MNPNYDQKVKEDLDKLLDAQFSFPIKITQWLSPFVIIPKKNGELQICVYYWKNEFTNQDLFPLPFLDSILDIVVRHEMYSFMDECSGYNQMKMAKEDKEKTSFIFKWGVYAYNVMSFGLCNAPTTFQKVVT